MSIKTITATSKDVKEMITLLTPQQQRNVTIFLQAFNKASGNKIKLEDYMDWYDSGKRTSNVSNPFRDFIPPVLYQEADNAGIVEYIVMRLLKRDSGAGYDMSFFTVGEDARAIHLADTLIKKYFNIFK